MTTIKTSVYDNIPALESWYQHKCEPSPIEAARNRRRANCGTVSFSAAPPAVYQYEENEQYTEENSRPPHRRQSSSESVKIFLKHYTNKLSRQLSSRSSRS
ncbi:hypothetical protein K501DRAFT_272476 [Backusella circina FSU 941]|nr:hypothetical protein K501DRAFT_272476 [Backusella circina FSU 941]